MLGSIGKGEWRINTKTFFIVRPTQIIPVNRFIDKMLNSSKRIIKRAFRLIGLDIVKMSKNPIHSLLGVRGLPIRTIVDVGANRGKFAKYASTLFPEARVYCFEPLPEAFEELSRWGQDERFAAFNFALGDKDGTLEMFSHVNHGSSSSFLKTTDVCESFYPLTRKKTSIPVRVTTLDRWAKGLPTAPTPEILIKLDVQGYEDRVIRGGKETFQSAKACIVEICLDKLYEDQATFEDILTLLSDLEYHYSGNLNQTYAEDGHVIFIDAVFVK